MSQILNETDYSDIEIYAWTSIPVTALSNMRNKKHKHLTCEQFMLLKLLLKSTHKDFLEKIFGKEYFRKVSKIDYNSNLTNLGYILQKRYKYELLPKKQLVDASKIKSNRIDYIVHSQDSSIRIDELTSLELALGEPLGTLCEIRFKKIRLNSQRDYEKLLNLKRAENARSNERRKPK